MFSTLLHGVGAKFELVCYAAHAGELPDRVDACDAWLISGSRAAVYEEHAWIAALMDFARAAFAADIAQVGICFGHQLLAHALGGRTEKAACGWGIGNPELKLQDCATALRGTATGLRLFMAHQDQVVALPPAATWLAEASHCSYAMFRVGERVLGLQPHPEFTAGFMRDLTLENALQLSPAQQAAALASHELPVDSARAARWIADFLAQRLPALLTPPR